MHHCGMRNMLVHACSMTINAEMMLHAVLQQARGPIWLPGRLHQGLAWQAGVSAGRVS
jgi:hypothetical protein